MTKAKEPAKADQSQLSRYKFDTTGYIVLERGVRRDSATGRLVSHRPETKANKPKE